MRVGTRRARDWRRESRREVAVTVAWILGCAVLGGLLGVAAGWLVNGAPIR